MITSQKRTKRCSLHYQRRSIWMLKKIAKSFSIDNQMDITAKWQCFLTIKDHKDNFRVSPRLIPQKVN